MAAATSQECGTEFGLQAVPDTGPRSARTAARPFFAPCSADFSLHKKCHAILTIMSDLDPPTLDYATPRPAGLSPARRAALLRLIVSCVLIGLFCFAIFWYFANTGAMMQFSNSFGPAQEDPPRAMNAEEEARYNLGGALFYIGLAIAGVL